MTDAEFLDAVAEGLPESDSRRLLKIISDGRTDALTQTVSATAGREIVSRLDAELLRFHYTEENLLAEDSPEFAVLFVDLDGLKSVNDACGHAEGDSLLELAGKTLNSVVARPTDYVIRWGGDEFVCIMRTDGYPQEPEDLATLMRVRIEIALGAAGVAASVGKSATGFDVSLSDAIQTADESMYLDKSIRKNGCIKDAVTGEEFTTC
jgi:diguanylate cyclase (GGDEF)-like protein